MLMPFQTKFPILDRVFNAETNDTLSAKIEQQLRKL